MSEDKKSDVVVLFRYFGKSQQGVKGFMEELRGLSDIEKSQLAEGIRNESYTY